MENQDIIQNLEVENGKRDFSTIGKYEENIQKNE